MTPISKHVLRSDGTNPFSTRCVRPGVLPYLFSGGEDVSSLVARLAENGWLGQIVGPHGSGKSTLLATMRPAIEELGKQVIFVELHDGQRRLPDQIKGTFYFFRRAERPFSPVLVIDGYEQLPWLRRRLLRHCCRRRGVGLLVTSHRSVGLPDAFRTHVDLETARSVVSRLLAGRSEVIADEDVKDCVGRNGQDLREALFELYDLFEQRRRPGCDSE